MAQNILFNFDRNKIIPHQDAKKLCYEFSVGMKGKHNPDTIQNRKVWEIFRDDFRGKFAEIAVRNKIIEDMSKSFYIRTDLDFSISPRGIWDTTDLEVGELDSEDYYSVSIKGVKKYSSNLLIETNRFNNNGEYSYKNNNGENIRVDSYVLVEVPIKEEFKWSIYDNRQNSFLSYEELLDNRNVESNILGGISHEEFWNIKAFAPRGIICTTGNLNYIYENKEIFNENNKDEYKNLPEHFNEDGKTWVRRKWNDEKQIYEYIEEKVGINYPITLQKDNYFVTKRQLKKLEKVFTKNNK